MMVHTTCSGGCEQRINLTKLSDWARSERPSFYLEGLGYCVHFLGGFGSFLESVVSRSNFDAFRCGLPSSVLRSGGLIFRRARRLLGILWNQTRLGSWPWEFIEFLFLFLLEGHELENGGDLIELGETFAGSKAFWREFASEVPCLGD